MSVFPGAIPAAGSANPNDTLVAAGHTSLHNLASDEIRAVATKIGTGSSTPIANTFLGGTGAGTSSWRQVNLVTDITGTLPVGNGGIGQTTLTGLTLPAAILTSAPTIADFTNANHTHASTSQGGQLDGSTALSAGTVTASRFATRTRSMTPVFKSATAGTTGNTYFPDAATNTGSWLFKVPDDYVSGDFTFKIWLRGGAVNGNLRIRRNSYRFRSGAAFVQIDTNVDVTLAYINNSTTEYSATISATNIAAGDVFRVDITRLGADGADTAAADMDLDGVWCEYMGRV